MAKITIQKGHCFRTSGATGGKGEQTFANKVGDILAAELRGVGHDVRVVLADEDVPDYRDVFIALHTDGSTNTAIRGASVGFPSSDTGRMAQAWKRAHQRAGYTGGFHPDNYTTALRSYYGFGRAVGYKHEYLAEHGMHSNSVDYTWMHGDYRRAAMAHFAAIGEIVGHPAPPVSPPPPAPSGDPTPTSVALTATAAPDGRIWTFARDGGVFTEGGAQYLGNPPTGHRPIVAARALLTGAGYRMVGEDGGVFCFGDAAYHGSTGGMALGGPICDMLQTNDNGGYLLVGADGGVFSFGNSPFFGSAVGHVTSLTKVIVGAAWTPDRGGYWLVGRDGAVYSFGNARFFGSLPGLGVVPNKPIEAILPTPDGGGYILVGGDGGLFAFGNAPAIQPLGQLQKEVMAGYRYIEDADWYNPGSVLFLVSNLGERYLLA